MKPVKYFVTHSVLIPVLISFIRVISVPLTRSLTGFYRGVFAGILNRLLIS